jgi:hypothetical protein
MGSRLGGDDAFELAFAELLRVLGKSLGKRIAHERGGGGPAGFETHPETDQATAHESAPVARQDFPRVEHDPKIHLALDAFEAQPLLDGKHDLADAEEADDSDDKIESLHQSGNAEGHAQLPGNNVEADARKNKPDHDRNDGLQRIAAAQAYEGGESQKLDRENFRRAESQRHIGQQRSEQSDQRGCEERANERRSKCAGERLTALALARQRITVEGSGYRPRLARNIEQHRSDGAAEQRAPIERCQQNDRRGRRHPERQRQQNGNAVSAAQTGEYADDRAEHDPDGGIKQVLIGQRLMKSKKEIFQPHQ